MIKVYMNDGTSWELKGDQWQVRNGLLVVGDVVVPVANCRLWEKINVEDANVEDF